jgi:BirA family biotin operon repressor/biotin-[acetyl-CoA-carboxylase] ligase
VLTASVVIEVPSSVLPTQLSLCAGLAVAHAIEDLVPAARIDLKWPNDCHLNGRKVAGVLCERVLRGRSQVARDVVVVGVGMNIDPAWDQQPAALPLVAERELAPASLSEIQAAPDMLSMLIALRRYLIEATGLLAVGGWPQLLPHLRTRDWLMGRPIEVQVADQRLAGIADGLDGMGCLLLRGDDQGVRTIASGSIIRAGARADV